LSEAERIPLAAFVEYRPADMRSRAAAFLAEMGRRRSVREFSDRPVPSGVIDDCLRTAMTAPSGANLQPVRYVVITSPSVKARIRQAAEAAEREFYDHLAPPEWLDSLARLDTHSSKPFLEQAPVLICIFVQRYRVVERGGRQANPYAIHSAGIATGLLVAAIHHAGLACLTYTPSRMGFLCEILKRPPSERPFLLLAIGFPAEGSTVPSIERRGLAELATFV
jgi:nitroreductase